MAKIGGQKKQESYLESLKQYRAEKREYLKNFRLKKKDLLKVWMVLIEHSHLSKIYSGTCPYR